MLKKIGLISLMALTVAACSSTGGGKSAYDEAMEVGRLQENADGTYNEGYGQGYGQGRVYEEVQLDGPPPGTQQDLTVNVGDRVFFGYDRYDLTSDARAQLEVQAQWLNQYPSTRIVIEGHADERGTREYNLALGDRRANAVRNYLVALGVGPNRINTISFGKEQPAVLGSDPQSWAQNRRSVTVVE